MNRSELIIPAILYKLNTNCSTTDHQEPAGPPNPNQNELIVDFQLIENMPHLSLIFSTNMNEIYYKDLDRNFQNEEVLYHNASAKSLIADHYISMIHYFKECDKVFAVS